MNTQRWQFNQNKLIGFGALFSLSVVLIAATTTLPVTAQTIRSQRTRFGGVYPISDRNTFYNNQFPGYSPGYVNPGYYPNSNPGPVLVNPTIRNSTLINPVIITPR